MKIFNVSEFQADRADEWVTWQAVTSVWPNDSRSTPELVIEISSCYKSHISLLFWTKEERDYVLQKFLERWREA